jgi:hypothetical protein
MSEELVRHIPGIGDLVYENYGAGEWLTAKGVPAKKPRRRYLLNGEELDSVSSIVSTLDKGDGLNYWYEDHGARGGVFAERMGELEGVFIEDIVKRVRSLGLGAQAARDEAAVRGTAIHAAFHMFAKTGVYPHLSDFPEEWRGWVQGVAQVLLTLEPDPIEAEFIVCHPELKYAGRPDLLCWIGEERTLIDYKTGNGRVYDSAHYQARGYAAAIPDSIDRILIVGISEDGTFELVECEATMTDFLDLLNTYRSRKRINAGMAAQRRAAKATT